MTTILTVRKNNQVAIGGDGQVSLGDKTVLKANAMKIRKLNGEKVIVGFAGSTADAFALTERFEEMLKKYNNNVLKTSIELAKLWRTDKTMRRLEALMTVVDSKYSLLISGAGDVIEPDDGIIGTGSGGNYAVAAARALLAYTKLSPGEIVEKSIKIASEICVFTNSNIIVETLVNENEKS